MTKDSVQAICTKPFLAEYADRYDQIDDTAHCEGATGEPYEYNFITLCVIQADVVIRLKDLLTDTCRATSLADHCLKLARRPQLLIRE